MTPGFPETHQTLVNYGKLGLAFMEAEPGETFDKAVQDIADGSFGGPDTRVVAVYRTGLGVETKDVSEEVCEALMRGVDHVNDLSSLAKRFLEDQGHGDFIEELDSFDPDHWRDERIERMRIDLL